jgi:predicted nucleic acid-binding protein
MMLVDTSVWVDHLHRSVVALAEALEREEVVTHPFVIGELACGTLARRREVLDLLDALPRIAVAPDEEALALIERRRLMGRGLGYIDVHLLASVLISDETELWTRDRHLLSAAHDLHIAFAKG